MRGVVPTADVAQRICRVVEDDALGVDLLDMVQQLFSREIVI